MLSSRLQCLMTHSKKSTFTMYRQDNALYLEFVSFCYLLLLKEWWGYAALDLNMPHEKWFLLFEPIL